MKKLCLVLLVSAMGLFLIACQSDTNEFDCTDSIGCVDIAPNEPIRIGVLQDRSGGAAPIGNDVIRSIEIAVADHQTMLLGHPIELQLEDERCTKEGGANAALRIVANTKIIGILGPTCSDAAITASEIMSEAGLVMISGTNITPSLTGINDEPGTNWHPGYFRTIHYGIHWGPVVASFTFNELGLSQAATINDGRPFTSQITDRFETQFEALGGKIVLSTTINQGDLEMGPVLEAVQDSGADLLFAPIFRDEAAELVIQAHELGILETITFALSEAAAVDPWVEQVGNAGKGIYFIVTRPPEGPEVDAFRAAFEATYNKTAQHSVLLFSYDAAQLFFSAIETVAVQDDDGILHIGRQTLRDAITIPMTFQE